MKVLTILAAGLIALPLAASAQEAARGSTPPGVSQDGSRASEGAIKGVSIAPGESAGVPDERRILDKRSAASRCKDLQGTLREQCLKDATGASTGGTRSVPGPIERDPRAAPPPQNPR